MNAKRIVDTLLEDDPKTVDVRAVSRWWEKELQQRRKDDLERIRGRYGRASDKAQPTPIQAKLIARWKSQGKERRIIDYCDQKKIDPNRVLTRLSTTPTLPV